jgi:hypothetical protein
MRRIILHCLLLGFSVFYQLGCSMIGLVIGAAAADDGVHTPGESSDIELEQAVTLLMRDSSTIAGTVLRSGALDPEVYSARYKTWSDNNREEFMRIGDTVMLTYFQGKAANREVTGELRGFDVGPAIKLRGGTLIKRYSLEDVQNISVRNGPTFDGQYVRNQLRTGDIPLDRSILLRTERGDTLIQLSDIASLSSGQEYSGMLVGLLVGGLLDAAALASLKNPYSCN